MAYVNNRFSCWITDLFHIIQNFSLALPTSSKNTPTTVTIGINLSGYKFNIWERLKGKCLLFSCIFIIVNSANYHKHCYSHNCTCLHKGARIVQSWAASQRICQGFVPLPVGLPVLPLKSSKHWAL